MLADAAETLALQAMLVWARLGAAVMLLPGLGEQDVPASIRLALGLALVALLLPGLAPGLPGAPASPAGLAALLATEIAIGLWLGTLARLVAIALAEAGQIAALMIGLASPLQMDPGLGAATTATGRLFALLGVCLLLGTGLYAVPLRALVDSYAVLPAGAPLPAGDQAAVLAAAVADSLALALRLAAPLLLLAMLGNLALALLARMAPQVPIFVVAIPAQILAGLALLALVLPAILSLWLEAAAVAFARLTGAG